MLGGDVADGQVCTEEGDEFFDGAGVVINGVLGKVAGGERQPESFDGFGEEYVFHNVRPFVTKERPCT